MEKVAFDTNFLIDCFRFKIDFLEEIEDKIGKCKLFVPDSVTEELEKIAKGRSKDSPLAKLVLKFLREKGIREIKSVEKKTDEELKRLGRNGFTIATNDRGLREELKSLRVKTIYLRARKRLEVG